MLTKRDMEVVEFVKDFGICRTSTLQYLFYGSKRVAQRRLKAIHKANLLKPLKYAEYGECLHYSKIPDQLHHTLMTSDFIGRMASDPKVKILEAKHTPDFNGIVPDAYIMYSLEGVIHKAVLEIQLSGKPNVQKYKGRPFEEIMIVHDSPFDKINLPIARFGTDLKFKE
jgi:hypothetical protein